MQDCDGLFPGVALAVIGLLILFKAYRDWREGGLTRRVAASACASVAAGRLVQVAGRAVGEATFNSDVLGAPCFVSRVKIDAHIEKDESKVWQEVYANEQGVSFYVEDQSGRVRIDPASADLELIPALEFSSTEPAKLKPEMLARVERAGMNAESLHGKLKEIYAQQYQKRYETTGVPVLGFFLRVVGFLARRPYRPELLNANPVISSMRQAALKEAAKNAASHLPLRCKEEYIQSGDLVYVLGPAQETADETGSGAGVVIARGNPSNPFLIGGGTRDEVRRRMRKGARNTAYWGLGVTTVAAVILIICYYGH